MKTISKLWQRFKKHISKIPFTFVLPLVALVALAVAVMLSDNIACCLQELLGVDEKYKVLKTIGFCIVGVLLVWQAWAANKRAKAMEATAREQANATKNTEKGQRQERLKNAIEHLGHKRDSVRMGGAYELFHLAKDTRDLRRTVMDILCAHIRQTTTGQTTRGNAYQAEHKTKPSEEIQSLLTLLFVQKHDQDIFEDCSINLQGSYLNGATLSLARLKKVDLRHAQLQGVVLRYAQLQGAKFYKARLQRAKFYKAQLQRAKLSEARLQVADFRYAQLQGAVLMEAQLQRAALWGAQLQGADLSKAQLRGAGLKQAQLQSADLREAQLQGANLRYAQLQVADLSNAQLQGSFLGEAQLQGAVLTDAQLQGVSSQASPPPPAGFERKINNRIGKDSDLTEIIFAGGLKEEDLDTLCKGLSPKKAQALREKLIPHIGKPASNKLPPNSGAVTAPPSPPYTQEEAEQWIVEYQEAMREVPKRDDD